MGSTLVEFEVNVLEHLDSFNATALENDLAVALNAALRDGKIGDQSVDSGSAAVQKANLGT